MAVLLETTLGDVVIDLYTEERPRGEARARDLLSPPPFAAQSPASTGSNFWAAGALDRAFVSRPWLEKFL